MVVKEYNIHEDRALVQMVIEGDSIAFDTLFARYREMIYNTLLKFTGNSNKLVYNLHQIIKRKFNCILTAA